MEYGMEKNLQNGVWKNRFPFHSIACPATGKRQNCLGSSCVEAIFGNCLRQKSCEILNDNKSN